MYTEMLFETEVSATFADICLEREKKKAPHREGKPRNSHLAFWESSALRKEGKKKTKKKTWGVMNSSS